MPRYDYRCKDCDCLFEGVSTVKARLSATCPKCGGESYISLERLNPSIQKSWRPYYDRGLDEMVYSRKDRKRKMRDKGLEEGGGGSVDQKNSELLEEARANRHGNR